jgi:hypothetical protein
MDVKVIEIINMGGYFADLHIKIVLNSLLVNLIHVA